MDGRGKALVPALLQPAFAAAVFAAVLALAGHAAGTAWWTLAQGLPAALVQDPFAAAFALLLALGAFGATWGMQAGTPATLALVPALALATAAVAARSGPVAIALLHAAFLVVAWVGSRSRGGVDGGEFVEDSGVGPDGDNRRAAALVLVARSTTAAAGALLGCSLLAALFGTWDPLQAASRWPLVLAAPGGRAAATAGLALVLLGLSGFAWLVPWTAGITTLAGRVPAFVPRWWSIVGAVAGLGVLLRFAATVVAPAAAAGDAAIGAAWSVVAALVGIATMLLATIAVLRARPLPLLGLQVAVLHLGALGSRLALPAATDLKDTLVVLAAWSLAMGGVASVIAAAHVPVQPADAPQAPAPARAAGATGFFLAALWLWFAWSLAAGPGSVGFVAEARLWSRTPDASRMLVDLARFLHAMLAPVASARLAWVGLAAFRTAGTGGRPAPDALAWPLVLAVLVAGLGQWPGLLAGLAERAAAALLR